MDKLPEITEIMYLCQLYDLRNNKPYYAKEFEAVKKKYNWDQVASLSVDYADLIYPNHNVIYVNFPRH